MFSKLLNITKDQVLFGTLIVTIGIFLASVFSYLLQFALGRLLTVSDYGTFNAFIALANIIGVPTVVLTTSLIKITSELKAKNEFDKLTQIFWEVVSIVFIIGLAVFLSIYYFRSYLGLYLNIIDSDLFLYFGMFLPFVFLNVVPASYLQGLLRFKAFAFASITAGFLRFLIPVLLVLWGFKVRGIFMGMTLAGFVMFFVDYLLLKKNFSQYSKVDLNYYYKKLLTFGLPVLFINLGMMLLNNMDLILVKKYFDETLAGYYAGTVTIGKVLLFGAGAVTVVMFPQISEAYTKGADYIKLLKKFLGIQIFLVSCGIIVFSLIPDVVAKIMFGEKFLPSVEYIPLFSVFVGLYVLVNFMIMFFLAIGRTKVFFLQIPVLIVQFILISYLHKNLYEVIKINVFVAGFLLMLIFLYYINYVGFNNRPGLQAGKNY